MKKLLLQLSIFSALLFFSYLTNAQSVTVGNGQFTSTFTAGNNNDYGPMRSVLAGASYGRWAMIYPRTVLRAIPNGASINSLEFRREGGTNPLQGTPNMKIYMRNAVDSVYGSGNIHWVNQAAAATLVYNGNPTAAAGASAGFKRFMLTTPFVYTGGHIEILIEYTQQGGQIADIPWRYDNATGVPAYVTNSVKYIIGSGTTFPNDSTNLTNLRKPQIIFNFPAQNNVGVDRIFASQYLYLNDTIVPSFYVKNTGLTTQNFTTTLQGPNGYTSTKTSTSIAPDSVLQLEFDPLVPIATGNFNYKIFTNLANDGYNLDDTLNFPVVVADPNAQANVFNNGPVVSDVGAGYNGYDLSRLSPPLTTLGANGNFSAGVWTAEKFWLPEGKKYKVDSVGFYAYQTGSGFNSNFTAVYLAIFDGDPSAGGQLIDGDTVQNALANTYFSGIMRASASTPLDSTRPIMRVVGELFAPQRLDGGKDYWVYWAFTTGAGVPFFPPISVNGLASTGDAIQRSSSGWGLANAGGVGYPMGVPFQVYYRPDVTSVEETSLTNVKVGMPYPNPANENVKLNVEILNNESLLLKVTDIQGRTVYSTEFQSLENGRNTLELPVHDLTAGLYLIEVISGNTKVVRKFNVK